jgi:hypothetical protein
MIYRWLLRGGDPRINDRLIGFMVYYIMGVKERWIDLYSITRPLRLHNQSGL